jgi:hypothetical protein
MAQYSYPLTSIVRFFVPRLYHNVTKSLTHAPSLWTTPYQNNQLWAQDRRYKRNHAFAKASAHP